MKFKFKIIVDLSTKIKKIPRRFFSGKFFSLLNFSANYFAVSLHNYDFHSSQ